MNKKVLSFFALMMASVSLFANGGIHWRVNGTGLQEPPVIKLRNDKDVILKKENLSLRFIDDSVVVSCDYVLFNKQGSDKLIDFAFNITESSKPALQYYNIYVDGIKLESELHTERIKEWEEEDLYNYWELSEIKLGGKKETNVSICYRVDTENDGMYYKSVFNDNRFVYNLFPALSFGEGVIEDFSITIDASDILGWNGKVTKIEGIDIPFNSSDRIITKSFKNFDLNKHKQLKISYNIKNFYFSKLYKEYGYRTNGITATSELVEGSTTYSAENLMDKDCYTAWVEGKADFGKNEKISISVQGLVTQILVVNGFRKSEKTYYENNRVKKMAVYVDGERIGEVTFPDRPYHQVNMCNLTDEGELINQHEELFNGSAKKIWSNANTFHADKRMELEILEVYPGTKYNDTCISDIYIIRAQLPVS